MAVQHSKEALVLHISAVREVVAGFWVCWFKVGDMYGHQNNDPSEGRVVESYP